jgi:hypothetical protein
MFMHPAVWGIFFIGGRFKNSILYKKNQYRFHLITGINMKFNCVLKQDFSVFIKLFRACKR